MKTFEKLVYVCSFVVFFGSLIIRFVPSLIRFMPSPVDDPIILTGIAIIFPYIFFGFKLTRTSSVHVLLHSLAILTGFLCLAGYQMGLIFYIVIYSLILTYDSRWITFLWTRIKN
ncbi:membrane hypothetical protein [Imperialibacter sp. 75]|nr:membrane hypothetical protein [Imperialibacter sp. 75]